MNKTIKYQIINGTSYHKETHHCIIDVLERCRLNDTRIRVYYGNNGKSWNEENDTIGYIGRSTGEIKVPLLIYNKRCHGGTHLLDHCIVKITNVQSHRILWQHPKFKQDHFEADDTLVYKCPKEGAVDKAEIYGNCETHEKAKRLANFMNGKTNAK